MSWLEVDGRARPRMLDLAELLGMTQSGVTRLVDRLIGRGWVMREQPPGNARAADRRGRESPGHDPQGVLQRASGDTQRAAGRPPDRGADRADRRGSSADPAGINPGPRPTSTEGLNTPSVPSGANTCSKVATRQVSGRRPCRQNCVHDGHAAADRRDGDLGVDGLGRRGTAERSVARSGLARPELADLCLLSVLTPERERRKYSIGA